MHTLYTQAHIAIFFELRRVVRGGLGSGRSPLPAASAFFFRGLLYRKAVRTTGLGSQRL